MAKRRLSAKQIKFFGTPRQKNALKAKRKSSHRPRSKPRRKNAARKVITGYGSTVMNPSGKTNVVFNKGKRANPKHRRTAKRRRTNKPARKRNLGAIYALTANPARRRSSMAAKTKKRKSSPRHHRAGSARRNPGRRVHHRRSNPGQFGNPIQWLYGGVGVIAGVVGTRALPQMILGSSNTGVMGYLANAAATALLTFAAHFAAPKNFVLKASVLAGGAASILSRIIQDYSLLGSYSASVGLGDYLMSDFLTPQTLTNGLQNAGLNKPGWASQASMPVNVAGAGVAGITGPPLY